MILPASSTRYCDLNQPQFTPYFLLEVECEKYESSSPMFDLRVPLQPTNESEKTFDIDLSQILLQSSSSLDLGIERSKETVNLLSQPSLLNPIPETYREAYEKKLTEVRIEIEQLKEKNSELANLTKKIVRNVERLEKKRETEIRISPKIRKRLPQEVQYILNQAYRCLESDLYDACGTMMRKALTAAIDIRFKQDRKERKMYDSNSRHLSLQKMIEAAKQERYISSSIFQKLNELKWVGYLSAHDYQIRLGRSDVEIDLRTLRMTLERLYPTQKKSQK
jgi:hypothetical protein